MATVTIQISNLTDPFQIRQSMDDATVRDYRENITGLPPILAWQNVDGQWVILDGRHRCEARRQEGLTDIEVVAFEGTPEEAEAKAWTANLKHGLPLNRDEKRSARTAVVRLLHPRTNNWIATELGCSPHTVESIRAELETAGAIPALERTERKGGGTIARTLPDDSNDGGYDDSEDDQPEEEAPDWLGGHTDTSPHGGGGWGGDSSGGSDGDGGNVPTDERMSGGGSPASPREQRQAKPGKSREISLKLAQIGEPITAEVVLYVDDRPESIPVTILAAKDSSIAGIETPPEFPAVLIIGDNIAKKLGLAW